MRIKVTLDQTFIEFLDVIKEMSRDERIHIYVREEYLHKFSDILESRSE